MPRCSEKTRRIQRGLVCDLGRIERSGRHLLALINDVLDLSKIEAGRMELHPETLRLDELLAEVVGHVRPMMDAGGNDFVVHDLSGVQEVVADRVRVKQVLLNMLSNAAKFTEGGRVDLSVSNDVRDGREVLVFDTTDTGIGIGAAEMAKLFRPFVQGERRPGAQTEGTGLGLVLSRRFAEMMGGQVRAASEPEVGSTFTFELPMRPAELQLDDGMWHRVQEAQARGRPVALCVAESEQEIDVLGRRLGQEGILAVPCRDGQQALALVRRLRPELLFADVRAHGIDGRDLLWQVREDPTLLDVAVVLCSSGGSLSLPSVPRVATLRKPVESVALQGVVRLLLQGAHPARQAG